MSAGGGVLARLAALEHEIRTLRLRVTSEQGGGVPAAPHASEHYDGGDDEVDVTQLGGFPGGSPKTYLDSDGAFSDPSSQTGVTGPGSSTDEAFARWDGAGGNALQDSVGATLDDAGRAMFKAVRIPMFDAGNSGTSLTIDWNNGNEQRITLTGNVTLTLNNPTDGGRYVLIFNQDGTGGRTVTWPAAVKWPSGSAPTITSGADKFDLVTLIYLSTESIYLGSFNQSYDD